MENTSLNQLPLCVISSQMLHLRHIFDRSTVTTDNNGTDEIGYVATTYTSANAGSTNYAGVITPETSYTVRIDYSAQGTWLAGGAALGATASPSTVNVSGANSI